MPLFVAPLLAFALGTLLALGPRGPLSAREQRFATRATAGFAALCFFPVAAFAAASEPAWSVAYIFDAQRVPPVLLVGAAGIAAALLPLGLRTGIALVAASVERRIALVVAPAVAAAVALAVHGDRLAVVGSHLAFTRASERALSELTTSRFGAALALLDLLLLAGAFLTYRALARLGEPAVEPRAKFGRPRLGIRAPRSTDG